MTTLSADPFDPVVSLTANPSVDQVATPVPAEHAVGCVRGVKTSGRIPVTHRRRLSAVVGPADVRGLHQKMESFGHQMDIEYQQIRADIEYQQIRATL